MRIFAVIGIALILTSCASGGGRPSDRERYDRVMGKAVANPSAIVKAELSFARLAQEEGQWSAFRKTAADEAIMFTPGLVNAQQWLKGKADPAQAVDWQPHKIYMSCDGSIGVSTGAWQSASGTTGHFTTIWHQENFGKRKPGKDVEWKWIFDDGVPLTAPLAEPDYVETEVASCKTKVPAGFPPTEQAGAGRSGRSADGSLIWNASSVDGGGRIVFVDLAQDDGSFKRVHEYKVDAPAP
ncbi:hypothetical protein [Sphingorhabdus sp. 109]|jgi:hypothetical protein|uniref:hypothetical protein n=1 Tax=Sphingorhabdus sp. 109 TaxID=2653173 RepID=UPI0012F314F1|nr:hypothetical protein [Sphingorhabdus sp. 109]VWX55884.1 conserved hypothetical protein [Sphingorhabdus sp. 109]